MSLTPEQWRELDEDEGDEDAPETCERCDGHGAVRAYGPIDDHAVCPDCNGTGWAQ